MISHKQLRMQLFLKPKHYIAEFIKIGKVRIWLQPIYFSFKDNDVDDDENTFLQTDLFFKRDRERPVYVFRFGKNWKVVIKYEKGFFS